MKTIILKLGGSIFMPEHIDTDYLKRLKELLLEYTEKNYRFIIIVGGGVTARKYQDALKDMGINDPETLDWMGISATNINAYLFRFMFDEDQTDQNIITDPTQKIDSDKKIIIGAGYKPGWSTDYDAMLIAKQFEDKMVVVLSNIEQIYDYDPKKNPNAKALDNMSWDELYTIVGDTWTPGKNVPMDPMAVKEGRSQGVKVVFADGKNLENFKNIIENKDYTGTTIE
ncbi:UMP kinase [archaeon D22]|nr:UMP kinase [archaeon D22]